MRAYMQVCTPALLMPGENCQDLKKGKGGASTGDRGAISGLMASLGLRATVLGRLKGWLLGVLAMLAL